MSQEQKPAGSEYGVAQLSGIFDYMLNSLTSEVRIALKHFFERRTMRDLPYDHGGLGAYLPNTGSPSHGLRITRHAVEQLYPFNRSNQNNPLKTPTLSLHQALHVCALDVEMITDIRNLGCIDLLAFFRNCTSTLHLRSCDHEWIGNWRTFQKPFLANERLKMGDRQTISDSQIEILH